MKEKSIAVFGGSFDPPHIGHVEVVKSALSNLDIENIFVVPTYLNPFKKKFIFSPQQRYHWLLSIFAKYNKVKVLDYEILKNKSVPTIETILFIRQEQKVDKIYLLIGDDNLETLPMWHKYQELKEMVEFVIIPRTNEENLEYRILPFDRIDISSTIVRDKIIRQDKSVFDILPTEILCDIERLYE